MADLIIVIGVAGSGKTTLAQAIAKHCNLTFLDADDFHSAEAKAHMASGQPLTDTMRVPWIERIASSLTSLAQRNESAALAFSGLKQRHREPLRHCGLTPHFLFLSGDQRLIAERMSAREGHFMPPALLDSQFKSLEEPDPSREPDVTVLDITPPPEELLQQAIAAIKGSNR
ncbi:gluconokinase [Marinimicrobium sp. ARAG 43.8]|uniref:gluconokinase n=1 Tax=Marinimicrobium sp. ARAG 43.8 TaxID=3418719 RepID=UPI003CFBC10D